jgi:thioredoxin-related protein
MQIKRVKKMTTILFVLCMAGSIVAGEGAWLTSFPEAAAQATKENKLLLLDFTGSDWCGWCVKLDGDTFSRQEFLDYASKNLVLVQLDYPMHKTQPDNLKQSNGALKQKYGVNGFPTVVITQPDGKVLWKQEGYRPGGPSVMIAAANQCRKAAGLSVPGRVAAAVPAPATVAAAAPKKPDAQPKLQGILYSASRSSVVLDGRSCEEGETIHGMRVIKIERDKVTVEFQGKIEALEMN